MQKFLTSRSSHQSQKDSLRQTVYQMLAIQDNPSFQRVYDWLGKTDYFTAPASASYHGAYAGGLAKHSIAVAEHLTEFTAKNDLKWERPASPILVGLLHDVCKIDCYEYAEDIACYQYHKNRGLFTGHGEKSILLLSSKILLTPEEVACIRFHMGAFTSKEEWDYYTRAVRQYPNVLWTHHADMIASQVQGL